MSEYNPPFNMTRGAAVMTAAPPFDFQNVILRVFPLRADIHALRLFCDRFLNISPYHLFEPAAPYVFLETINYGKMSAAASNFGWVSQNEVAFAVLLNWYEIQNGKPVFKDAASVCPFIFVDEETSIRGGREVFGWPKSLAWLTPGIDAWARDPRSPRTLFTLSAMVFPELFAGQRQEIRTLFEIEQEPPLSAAEFPVDPFNELNPMVSLPRTVMNSMKMAGDMLETLVRLPIRGFPASMGRSPGRPSGVAGADFRTAPPWEILGKAFGNTNPFAQLPAFNTVNLKQFRDSERPGEICYQALVNAKMTAKSVKRGGLLGQQAMALGDPSGGYSLKLHRHKAWPIIESLGLEVAAEATERGGRVATLKPIMPNWMETDFHYGTGEVLCWRSSYSEWAKPGEEPKWSQAVGAGEPYDVRVRCREPHPYNTAQGGSLEQVRGPFHFNNVTMRVLPLLADEKKLQAFCDGYLNHRTDENDLPASGFVETPTGALEPVDEPGRRPGDGLPNNLFRAWGTYVYLITTNFDEMTSDLNVGWWARRQVAFAFPVKWYRYREEDTRWHLVSTALVSPFIYADSSVAATTGREMQGRPVVKADIEAAPSAWLDADGPARAGDLLKLSADVYPALNVGQKIERRTLLEITGRDVLERGDEEGWRRVAAIWGETLFKELRSKQGPYRYLPPNVDRLKGLALEILSSRCPINHLSLKQFRDAGDPSRACYQAITLSPERLKRIYDLREIDERLHVKVHRYPSQPIVETLGLVVKREDSTGEGVVDYLQPIRPFWLRADVEAPLGRDVFWRAGDSKWRPRTEGFVRGPQCLARPGWDGSMEDVRDPLLFFERPEPIPFGSREATWVDVDPTNKQRLQDLASELTLRRVTTSSHGAGLFGGVLSAAAEPAKPWSPEEVRCQQAAIAAKNVEFLERPLHTFLPGSQVENPPSTRPVTPQMALESILSSEWLHFGRPRWEQRKAAVVGEFDRRVRQLALAEGLELLEKLQVEGYTPEQLKEELATADYGAPPLKKMFIIRQDSIGHPETRLRFEQEYGLMRLDNEYWYYLDESVKAWKRKARLSLQAAVWDELEESWREELGFLRDSLFRLSKLEGWPDSIEPEAREELREEITSQFVNVADLERGLEERVRSAAESGEFERDYRYIQSRIQDARGYVGMAKYYLELLSTPTFTTPLDSVKIDQLGPKRLATLAENGITHVEELSMADPEVLAGVLGVRGKVAQRMVEQATELRASEPLESPQPPRRM